jgi:hypothetical protein
LHEQAFGFLFKIIVSFKSTVGFVLNFKQFQFKRCKISSKKFSTMGVVARKLNLLEVEGVEIVFFFSNLVKIVCLLEA